MSETATTGPRSVSCTILAYNEEETLEQAVRDVHGALSALGRPFEVLVVDDGSTDRTATIAAELEARLPEVRLLRHGRNLGPGSAILTGIRNARCHRHAVRALNLDSADVHLSPWGDVDGRRELGTADIAFGRQSRHQRASPLT